MIQEPLPAFLEEETNMEWLINLPKITQGQDSNPSSPVPESIPLTPHDTAFWNQRLVEQPLQGHVGIREGSRMREADGSYIVS